MDYRTGLTRLLSREGAFSGWELEGACLDKDGRISLDPARGRPTRIEAEPGPVGGEALHAGGEFLAGTATSPPMEAGFDFAELLPSWEASTPPGSWLELWLRAAPALGTATAHTNTPLAARAADADWSPWYNLGIWAEDGSVVKRHSVTGQKDDRGSVSTDTLVLAGPAALFQVRLGLFGSATASPIVRAVTVASSSARPASPPSVPPDGPRLRGLILEEVPQSSQMVYPDGGKVWCSPVALSMVLGHHESAGGGTGVRARGTEARVRETVAGVYDAVYEGYGNWSFNSAHAAAKGCEACVARFRSLAELEPFISSGIPVVMSVSWDEGKGRPLAGAPISNSRGHLTLLIGFDDAGDPVMHEPAAPTDAEVRRTYRRAELEARWLEASGGAAYLVSAPGQRLPIPSSSTKARWISSSQRYQEENPPR